MAADPRRRKNLRLPDFDYTTPGGYFITICAQERRFLLDPVPVRDMIRAWWDELPGKFPNVATDEFVIMPNHIHGIITLTEPACSGGHDPGANSVRGDLRVAPASLPRVIQWFKTMTTNEYIRAVRQSGWPPFPGRLWQRNYYEHVIRDERQWEAIRQYIRENPAQWEHDRENPACANDGKGGYPETPIESEFRT